MRALGLANLINIVLDPCLIFGWGPFPALGLTGAAVATCIGRGVGVMYQFWMMRNGRGRLQLRGPAFRVEPKVFTEILRLSAGTVGQFLIATTSWVVLMRIFSYGYVFYAWGMATVQGFNGAGDTLTPTWIHFFCFWVFEIPLAWTLAEPLEWGPNGVFWSVCLAESLLAVVAVLMFRRGRWKTTQLAADVTEPTA